ncbi:peptidase dimerization domain-containingprotein [Purpureocillium lavendulum]|uniref:Peptidase dimerization domain-containingprotein n=1 Tax=Purpureocillium lavendulum TaxID=1247861 RepID=A0AB34FUC9_9HYPO|nr:peptidase dimerization domain-containingprotein [Purpureocillium lavendulum]
MALGPATRTMAPQSLEEWTALIARSIDEHFEAIKTINYKIHADPELAYNEHHAHEAFTSLLSSPPFSSLGITVTPRAYGLDTAFSADYISPAGSDGDGGRLVVFNAEYDALPGIGHACGHNLIASASLAAFLGLVAALHAAPDRPRPPAARVRLLGTPAEEGGGGKLHLIRGGAYAGAAACLMTHPGPQYLLADPAVEGVAAVKMLANVKWRVRFAGRTAHAAMEPWNGVNALDAVCLSYNAVSMLRQQIRPHERIHGVFGEAGDRPNVIPGRTSVDYYVRSNTLAAAERLWARVKACFEGAAVATGCTVTYEALNSYADLRSSMPLCRAFVSAAASLPPSSSSPSSSSSSSSSAAAAAASTSSAPKTVVALDEPADFLAGSTDMGNVTYECPGFHGAFGIDTQVGQGNHTAAFADASGLPRSLDRAVAWGKAMAVVGWRVLADDAFAREVHDEWVEDMKRAAL